MRLATQRQVFVPILSKACLAPFAHLEASSRCDNVLLEYQLALICMRQEKLHRITVRCAESRSGIRIQDPRSQKGVRTWDAYPQAISIEID
mgnify:CR=1 FL=1|jgi:hypothetical protein